MKRLLLAILGTTSILFGTSSLASAASFTETEFRLTFNTPPSVFDDKPIEVCGFVGICNPDVAGVVPDVNPAIPTPPQPYINDTGFTITGLFAKLPENPPAGPSLFVEGTSDIFGEINISENGQELAFTEGTISVNEIFFADFETEPEANSELFITLTTIPKPSSIPEPSSLLGILVFGFLSTGLWFGKRRNQQQVKPYSSNPES